MRQIQKTELSPDNGCVIDTKWKLGNLSYHASAAGKVALPLVTEAIRLPELVVFDHTGFKGAYARTNLSFHFIGDFIATNITKAITGTSALGFTKASLPRKALTTSSVPSKQSR